MNNFTEHTESRKRLDFIYNMMQIIKKINPEYEVKDNNKSFNKLNMINNIK